MPRSDRTRLHRLAPALALAAFGALVWAEYRRPLRRRTESKPRRNLRNLAVAAAGAATLRVVERPVVVPLAQRVERERLGLVPKLGLPAPLADALSILLLDYTIYVWHVMLHRIPLLWRFHLVHHADLDLDASTALRFHFGELALSAPFRAAQVRLIGASPRALRIWQNLFFASVVFHHSDLRLPPTLERALARVVVTPRLHGIHHSIVLEETNSNWSSGLTLWDLLHGTLRADVPQDEITIGVPDYRDPAELTAPKILAMPFREERRDWRLPDGTHPLTRRMPKARRKQAILS